MKKENNDLQTRRDFFKKAAEKTIPMLGILMLTNGLPFLTSCKKEDISGGGSYGGCDCSGGCTGSCRSGCTGTCSTGCAGACGYGCAGSCSGDCDGSCSGTCSGTCASWCSNSCEGNCRGGCRSNARL